MHNLRITANSNMPEDLIYLIIKRLTNSIDGEEAETLQKWLDASPANRRVFDEVSDIWLASAINSNSNFDSVEALDKVKLRLRNLSSDEKDKKKPLFISSLLKVAAFALFLLGTGALSYYAGIRKYKSVPEITEIEAPAGSRTKVNLPDGSKVWLNGGSTLKFSNSFNKTDRIVSITGEGYFDVKQHSKKIPFVVNTTEIRIKVLGTAFNIRAYPEDGAVETTLERGSLAIEKVTPAGKAVPQTVLEPNQRATYIKHEGQVHLSDVDKKAKEEIQTEIKEPVKEQLLISKKVDTHIFTSWKDSRFVFRNEPFESLVVKLERWYGVNIVIEDEEIKSYHFNGTFDKETIHDVLKIIHYTLPIKYTVNHDQVYIRLDKSAWKGRTK